MKGRKYCSESKVNFRMLRTLYSLALIIALGYEMISKYKATITVKMIIIFNILTSHNKNGIFKWHALH